MYKVGFRLAGQTVVLSSEDSLARAIERGDLNGDTRVLIEDRDTEVFVGRAAEFPWLAERLDPELAAPVVDEPQAEPGSAPQAANPDAEDAHEAAQDSEPHTVASPKTTAAVPSTPVPPPPISAPPYEPKPSGNGLWWLAALVVAGLVVAAIFGSRPRAVEAPAATDDAWTQTQAPAQTYTSLDAGDLYQFPEVLMGNETFQIGELVVALASTQMDGENAAVVTLTDLDGQSFRLSSPGRYAHARFGVGDLDGDGRINDLILTSYTGGAHCCTQIVVATKVAGQWRGLDAGLWDGDGLGFPVDHGGDRAPEFLMVDNSFLYAFAPYAFSYAPVQILKLKGGEIVDVSTDRAYRQVHINRMAELEPLCRNGENGACAAYVASAARIGSMSHAWSVMLQSYSVTDWILPTACLIVTDGVCPPSMEVRFDTYPEALQYFLGERGYASKAYVSGREWDGKPSFECTDSLGDVLRLICSEPQLRLFDHAMAVAYTRAMAFSHDRAALQREQQGWVRARNALPADAVALAQAYQDRLEQLLPRQAN